MMKMNKLLLRRFWISLLAAFMVMACQFSITPVTPGAGGNASLPTGQKTVAPVATDTLLPTATNTREPTATDTPLPTDTEVPPPTATEPPPPTHTLQDKAQVVPTVNAFCRKGPGTGYFAITFLQMGVAYNVVGRNDLKTWWLVQLNEKVQCWVSDPKASLLGLVEQVEVVLVPPLPAAPASLDVSYTCDAGLKVFLGWSAVEGATGYHIYRNGDLQATVGAGSVVYHEKAPLGVKLVYEVEAFNEYGVSVRLAGAMPRC
jgi:hypothetical protein